MAFLFPPRLWAWEKRYYQLIWLTTRFTANKKLQNQGEDSKCFNLRRQFP
ncbi:MAG: hypothetical protein LBR79_00135 [Oscillospiraceae bacterium]|nr:hypothetical protein [Oscillospiraceae bacterium]